MNGTPPRGKALPPRPSADLGYREGPKWYGSGLNGYKDDENANLRSYDAPKQNGPRGGSQELDGRIALDGYRNEIMNGFETPKPRYNPVSSVDLRQE
jgi:hypothetical protein